MSETPRKIEIPELCLVVLIGASGSGKSTLASRCFGPFETISSDFCRGLVADDENDQTATAEAFETLHFIAGQRLKRGHLTVVDATNVQREARAPLIRLARSHDLLPVGVVLKVPEKVCVERNRDRPERDFGPHVVRRQAQQLRRSLKGLKREGFRHVAILEPEDIDTVEFDRRPLWTDKRSEHGPFDVVGDVHGCFAELQQLLDRLGWRLEETPEGWSATHPEDRRLVFLGDLTDRGPDSPAVLRLVMDLVEADKAWCLPGNHDDKLARYLSGRKVKIAHGLQETIDQLSGESDEFREQTREFIRGLISHFVLDDGKLVVAHAGMKEPYQGRASGRVRDFALYGETTGEVDEDGLPVRIDWAAEYRGDAHVVYGHTPVREAQWQNRTINIDTGCVFGGSLTALRWPERELVSVEAADAYAETPRELAPPPERGEELQISDVLGKRIVATEHMGNVTIREENSHAALEVMTRFAVDPRWLIYLPPTMSPSETSERDGYLEHPAEALAYFRNQGVEEVVAQEKHMGSRLIAVVCRDAEAAKRRFRVSDGDGVCFTRTGRRFFPDQRMEEGLLAQLRESFDRGGLWEELQTDWVCLDCELMPWSAKAAELIEAQYAPVATSAEAALAEAVEVLTRAESNGRSLDGLREHYAERLEAAHAYADSWRPYAWPVSGLADLRLAPFHLLASEGRTYFDRSHDWHLETLGRLVASDDKKSASNDQVIATTRSWRLRTDDETGAEELYQAWDEMTNAGGEGFVVKPLAFTVRGKRGLVQPGIKSRGREYLRIIYGPEYTLAENLSRLRQRSLGRKRGLALREYALGVEALRRFTEKEPLHRVHECVYGVLALESEPVDPRL